MRLLLDTHVFMWWDIDPAKLSPDVLRLCQDQSNILMLSVASVWEMQIKTQLGKLSLGRPLAEIIESQQAANKIELLPVQIAHVLALQHLPPHHKDPFDRLLVAQALTENLVLVSADSRMKSYPVTVLW